MPIASGLQPNIFRAVSGSLFSSPVNWSRGVVPTGSDVAMIADNCTIDISRTIGSLIVRAPFTASVNSGLTLNVSQSFLINGYINFLGGATVFLSGKYNEIVGMAPGLSTVIYRGDTEQLLPGGPYYNLQTSWYDGVNIIATTKKSTSNLVINGSLQINYGILELGKYDYYCSGSTNINGGLYGILSKNQPGNIIFNGALKNTAAGYPINLINFSNGNPNVEVRNGIDLYQYNIFNTGKGTWRFTTNNQNIYNTAGASTITFDGPISIENINLSILANASTVTLNDVINGTTPTSQLITSGTINFNTLASLNSMTTGSFNFTSSNNTIGFTGNYSATIPSRFNVLRNLVISGTGTKTLATSSIVSGSLTNNNNSVLELGNHDLFVSGTTSVGDGNANVFRKSGPGNITFVGEVSRLGWNSGAGSFNLSVGNPNVECRGGLRTLGANTSTFNSGFGTWSFAVNNQSIYLDNFAVPSTLHFSGSILIKDGINLSIGSNTGMGVFVMQTINGTTSVARLTNSGSIYFASSSKSMTTGTLDLTFPGNLVGWTSNDNHPLHYSTYNTLFIGGSGTKYATSSLYMSSSLIVNNGALDIGTYDMFVSGTSTLQGGNLIKTSSGNIVFNGQINTLGGPPTMSISASYIELRNGINLDFSPVVLSTQTFYFTTNNQTVTSSNAYTNPQLNNTNFIISGAINLTISPAFTLTFTGYMDGTNPNSKLIIGRGPVPSSANGGIVYYSSSIMPMATSGTLDASSSLNVFVYNGGAQDIKGGIYRNLTFQGGTKTLRGNVSVLNTLNTGSVTVNLNGFTLTNP